MSTVTQTPPEASAAQAVENDKPQRSIFANVVGSEWTKMRSVPSTVWSLLATIAITVGFGALLSWAYISRYDRLDPRERLTFDPTAHSLRGLFLAQLAIGVLGVLIISSEYTTGLIRPTFSATPQRRTVLAAKAVAFGTVALVVSAVATLAAFAVGQSILAGKHLGASLGDPGVARAVCGATAYLVFIGLLGLGLGTIVRRTAGAIASLFGLVLVLPLLALALPSPWNTDVSKVLPGEAGQALFAVRHTSDLLTPGVGALVCLIWLTATFILAAVLITRRDA
jgi:ABC-type transport system involved in multi-copper enzyme maturation permease subunit